MFTTNQKGVLLLLRCFLHCFPFIELCDFQVTLSCVPRPAWDRCCDDNSHSVAIFQEDPGKLVPEYLFWISLEHWMLEVVVTTGAIRHAKLQSNHHHHQQNNTEVFYRPDAFPVNQHCQSTERRLGWMLERLFTVTTSLCRF